MSIVGMDVKNFKDVKGRAIEIIAQQTGVSIAEIEDDSRFVDDLGADSLDSFEIVMELEEEFDITIPDEELGALDTVGKTVSYIEGKLRSPGSS